MPQRVYLVPTNNRTIAAVTRLVSRSTEQAEEAWKFIRTAVARHQRIAFLSRSFAAGMANNVVPEPGTASFETITVTRPYFATSSSYEDAARVIGEVCTATDENDAFPIFQEETRRVGKGWLGRKIDDRDHGEGTMWMDFRVAVGGLRAMRYCYQQQMNYSTETLRKLTANPEFHMWPVNLNDTLDLPTGKIPAQYGRALGEFTVKLLSLTEPTWCLGKDYWVGRLASYKLNMMDKIKLGKFQDDIVKLGRNPAEALRDASLPGFEYGFDKSCPPNSTGLYLPESSAATLLDIIQTRRALWEQMTRTVTGCKPEETPVLIGAVEEAMVWAKLNGRSFIEVDEIPGRYGGRSPAG